MTIQSNDIASNRTTQDDMVAKVTLNKTDSLALNVYHFKAEATFLAPAYVWYDLIDSGDGKLTAQPVTKQPSGMKKR